MTVLSDNTYGCKHVKALSLWLGQTFDTSMFFGNWTEGAGANVVHV